MLVMEHVVPPTTFTLSEISELVIHIACLHKAISLGYCSIRTKTSSWCCCYPLLSAHKCSSVHEHKKTLLFLQQHLGFQYHQGVPEGRQLLEVLRGLWDQEVQVDPRGERKRKSDE